MRPGDFWLLVGMVIASWALVILIAQFVIAALAS